MKNIINKIKNKVKTGINKIKNKVKTGINKIKNKVKTGTNKIKKYLDNRPKIKRTFKSLLYANAVFTFVLVIAFASFIAVSLSFLLFFLGMYVLVNIKHDHFLLTESIIIVMVSFLLVELIIKYLL